jgi:hypothetical protein
MTFQTRFFQNTNTWECAFETNGVVINVNVTGLKAEKAFLFKLYFSLQILE